MIQKEEYIERIQNAATAIIEAGKANLGDNLSARVPNCSDWNLAQLIEHQSGVFMFGGTTVQQASEEPGGGRPPDENQEEVDGEAVIAAFDEATKFVLDSLKAAEMDQTAWNWTGDPNKAHFWFRRMTHESAIHAFDAKACINEPFEIPEKWGVDGTDEYMTSFLPFRIENLNDAEKPTGSFHLHSINKNTKESTDENKDGGEWFCAENDGEINITREHQKGDAALQGSGEDLMLAVWRRLDLSSDKLQLMGDKKIAEKWMSLAP